MCEAPPPLATTYFCSPRLHVYTCAEINAETIERGLGGKVIRVNTKKKLGKLVIHDSAYAEEQRKNRENGRLWAQQLLQEHPLGAEPLVFLINCNLGRVRSTTLACHLIFESDESLRPLGTDVLRLNGNTVSDDDLLKVRSSVSTAAPAGPVAVASAPKKRGGEEAPPSKRRPPGGE